jgi:hypothetical protein
MTVIRARRRGRGPRHARFSRGGAGGRGPRHARFSRGGVGGRLARRAGPPAQGADTLLMDGSNFRGLERSDRKKALRRNHAARLNVFADEFGDLIHRRTGIEDAAHARFLEQFKILFRNDAADQEEHIIHLVLAQ